MQMSITVFEGMDGAALLPNPQQYNVLYFYIYEVVTCKCSSKIIIYRGPEKFFVFHQLLSSKSKLLSPLKFNKHSEIGPRGNRYQTSQA